MTTVQLIKTQLASTKSVASQYGLEKELEKIDKLISYGESKQLSLFVCGEFKRGKSSFINALLSEEVCPVAEGIATSVVSIIRYGKNRKVIRHYGNMVNEQVEPCKEEIPFEKIAAYADGTVSDIDNTIMLEIEIPAERLKNGLTIIDTPGVGSLDPRHLFLTLYALPKADVIFFITDVGEPLTSTELDFYKKHILSTGKPNRIIVNKSDSKLREECNQIILDTKHKFEEHCGVKNVHVLPVSAKLWLEYNEEPDNEKKRQKSHMDDVLAAIEGVKKDYEQYSSELVRSRYIESLQQLIDLINNKKEDLSNNNEIKTKKEELQHQLTELKKIRNNIASEHSDLRKEITSILKTSRDKVSKQLQRESILLSTEKLDELIEKYSHESDGGQKVANEINADVRKLSQSIDDQIDNALELIMKQIEKEFAIEDFVCQTNISGHLKPKQMTMGEKICSMVQKSLPALTIGGIAGAVIWWPVGLVLGIAYVATTLRRDKALERAMEIKSQLSPRIAIAINELNDYIKKRYESFNEVVIQSITDTTQQMTVQMQDVFNLLKECEDYEQQKKAKLNELNTQIKFLNTQLIQAKVVNTNPFAK